MKFGYFQEPSKEKYPTTESKGGEKLRGKTRSVEKLP